ncbi:Rab guanyl-nucleotide exchange factor [Desmophyllum pertusum]|uniref:Rab guanyl-nucleotide exchange factor n=1 Tax=Desmophyllum pertusum TaxID=174260 RepID=A0A9W9YWT2_9CNID|nr:Rab guanyl-nucleotide exchange factor [Desmophyllum pertusum]
MDSHFSKLPNSLIEICVVVGMDQDTGLKPASSPESRKVLKGSTTDHRLFSTMYETNVLAALSGEVASFPYTTPEFNGEPFYPTFGVLCSPAKGGNPSRHRRGSFRGSAAELPLAQDVINSLPPLCFPEGGFISKKKKPVICHSLVLTDIEGNRTYCTCMTFYRGFIIQEDEDIPGNYKLFYTDEKSDGNVLQDSSHKMCYVPTCCCLISKWPYLNIMKDCLSSLLPQVMTSDSRRFKMALMQFVSQLAMVPVPPPGSLGIEFELYGVNHLVRPAEDPDTRVINMDLHYPFLYFTLDDILLLIGCILTQQRIVFISPSYSLLTPIIESLFTFIQPFSWSWTYVPILPSALIDLVEAPGAFIMGCHSQYKSQIQRVVMEMDELSSIVIADIDEGSVTLHPKARLPRLPTYATDMYKFRMKNAAIHFDRLLIQRQTFYSLKEFKEEREQFVRDFQQLVLASTLEMMLRMFSDMKSFIDRQEDLFFDMDSYIESKPSEDQEFYREVCKSHAFSTFLYDLMHDPEKTDYFTLMAQKTRVIPKVGPLRKRSSSTVPVPVISEEYFVNPQENLSIFVLPPFTLEGIYTGSFYEEYLKSLNYKISDLTNKTSSLLANYLYLRGMLRIACGHNIKAVDDFFGVSSRNVQLFPTTRAKNETFWRKAEHLRQQSKEKIDFWRDRKEVVTSAIPSNPLVLAEFVKHVSMLQIANSQDAGTRLFQALTMNSRTEVVDPETFAGFLRSFHRGNECASIKAKSVSLRNVLLEENEYVLKISQHIKTNQGMGWLVLTFRRLLFLPDGTQYCTPVVSNEDIKSVKPFSESLLSRGITAIKITSKSKASLSFVASVKEDKDSWRNCLLEIKAGYAIADAWKDPQIIKQAAQNVIMADALTQSDYPEQTAMHVLYFSTQSDFQDRLSDHTRKTLIKRVSPSPQDMEKTTVEALLYVPASKDSGPKVWCAMGSGLVVVIDADEWEYEAHMRHAKDRVSCLLAVGKNQVWAGSLDTTIYVINTLTGKADQQLLGHRDSLSHMIETRDSQGHTTVWSASSNGQIVGWDPVTLTAKKELQVKLNQKDRKTLYWFAAVGDTFWCATRFSVYVINYERDHEATKVLTPEDGVPLSIDCMCKVSDTRVWTGCDRKGLIVTWNTDTCKSEHCDACKCAGGFTYMLPVDNKVWAGSKSGTIYVMNSDTCQVEMELCLHQDRVRSMCITDYGFVISGPGSRDGRIAVWRSHLTEDNCSPCPKPELETVEAGICEGEQGFQMVCKKDTVQFDLDRNETHYLSKSATY